MVIDANVLVALYNKNDSCHARAKKAIETIDADEMLLVPVGIVAETFTVLVRYKLYDVSQDLLDVLLNHQRIIIIPEDTDSIERVQSFVKKYVKKSTLSYQDISLIVFADYFEQPFLSFDNKLRSFAKRCGVRAA